MEGRMRKYGQTSPERTKIRGEPPPPPPSSQRHHHQHQKQQVRQQHLQLQQGMKIPVVYYLCRNRHLEHPHFIEVTLSSPDGLHLRDVIDRLNVLRGKGMAAMYSWSCKRSYKSGFVWHDLSEDDLILPAHGTEYVLKGSELLDSSPPDRSHQASSSNPKLQNHKYQHQDTTLALRSSDSSPSSSAIILRELDRPLQSPTLQLPRPPSPQEDELSPTIRGPNSSSGDASPESKRNSSRGSGSSSGLAEYKVFKPNKSADASTQTENNSGTERRSRGRETSMRGVSTNETSTEQISEEDSHSRAFGSKESPEIRRGDVSPPPTSSSTSSSCGKTETLESLIRADARKMNSFRIFEEKELFVPTGAKVKATNVLMQLITCGSITVKDHHRFGLVPTYKPRFSHVQFPSPMFSGSVMLGELDYLSENPRFRGLRLEEKEYFSGSIIETKKHKEDEGETVPVLKRSSSYNADRTCKSPDPASTDNDGTVNSTQSKCLPRAIKLSSCKQSKIDLMRSPLSDGPKISSKSPSFSQPASLSTSKNSSKRFADTSSGKGSSARLESFRKDKEKVVKIEESLLQVLGL